MNFEKVHFLYVHHGLKNKSICYIITIPGGNVMDDIQYRMNHFYNTYFSNKIINKALCLYNKKLEDLLKDDKPFSKDLLNLLYIVSNFIMRKEETIEEIANKYELKVNKLLIDGMIKQIADSTNDKGKFTVSGVTFDDPMNFINLLRNKFAHGAYKYVPQKGMVEIIVDDKILSIPLQWLIIFNRLVFVEVEKVKSNGHYMEGILKIGKNSFTQIKSYQDFKRSFTKMKYYEFIITPKKEDRKYDEYENGRISQLIQKVCEDFNEQVNYEGEIRTLRKYCESKDLNLQVNIIPVSNFAEPEKAKLKNMYQNSPDFNDVDAGGQVQLIGQWIMDTKLLTNTVDHVSQGYAIVQDFIDYIDYGKSYETFCKEYPKHVLYYDKCITSIFFAQFNIVYAYNAEEIYENHLDYSKLDLSKIKHTISKFEDLELISLENQLLALQTRIFNATTSVEQAQDHLDKLLLSIEQNTGEEGKYEKGKTLLNSRLALEQFKLDELKKAYFETNEKRQNRIAEIESRKQHYENKNVISHIRNSLAHGNFEVERFDTQGTLGNSQIHFQDIYKGENTFDSVISLEDFTSLFDAHNYKVIFEMYTNLVRGEQEKHK